MSTKRILVLGPPKSGKFTFLKELTGSTPSLSAGYATDDARPTHAGLSHTLTLKTKYFEAEVPIWIDEYDDTSDDTGIRGWASSFSSAEAHEVVSALGAIIFTFRKPETRQEYVDLKTKVEQEIKIIHDMLLSHYKSRNVDSQEEDEDDFDELINWDGISLAVAIPSTNAKTLSSDDKNEASFELDSEEWEMLLQPYGFEFIDIEKKGRNDYGELLGLERIKEALETFSWDATDATARARQRATVEGYDEYDSDGLRASFGGDKDELDSEGFDQELREMQLEMAALHFAMDPPAQQSDRVQEQNGEFVESGGPVPESDFDELERIMARMKQVKEQGEGLPFEERKKLADKVAEDLLRLL
ncbi:hypothetical protein V1525DRAFT_405606 [Lipomyces kononenkoae]|uniref:Uncharacterized protein n=1 Tax=Lipomyces kononenkoae TaxID=34357 RepID=A0ACC3SZ03_LIPKO